MWMSFFISVAAEKKTENIVVLFLFLYLQQTAWTQYVNEMSNYFIPLNLEYIKNTCIKFCSTTANGIPTQRSLSYTKPVSSGKLPQSRGSNLQVRERNTTRLQHTKITVPCCSVKGRFHCILYPILQGNHPLLFSTRSICWGLLPNSVVVTASSNLITFHIKYTHLLYNRLWHEILHTGYVITDFTRTSPQKRLYLSVLYLDTYLDSNTTFLCISYTV